MVVESIGPTVHLVRREKNVKIPKRRGFYQSFVAANTIWDPDVRGSAVHRRVIRHSFAGITSIVRFVPDGYLPDKVGDRTIQVNTEPPLTGHSSLSVDRGGEEIPHAALFDLKTRSTNKSGVVKKYLPRLWLTQIPNFVTAFHDDGLFSQVHVEDIRPALAEWESSNAENLAKFAALLRKIMSIAHARPDQKFEIVREEGSGVLEIRELAEGAPSTLPEDMEEEWKAWLDGIETGEAVHEDNSDDEDSGDGNYFTGTSDDEDESNLFLGREPRNE